MPEIFFVGVGANPRAHGTDIETEEHTANGTKGGERYKSLISIWKRSDMALLIGGEKIRQRARTVDVVNMKHDGLEVVPVQGVSSTLRSQMAIWIKEREAATLQSNQAWIQRSKLQCRR